MKEHMTKTGRSHKNGRVLPSEIGSDLDGEAAGDESGVSVSLSANSKVVTIGAPYNGGNGRKSGHVRLYERNSTMLLGWSQIGSD